VKSLELLARHLGLLHDKTELDIKQPVQITIKKFCSRKTAKDTDGVELPHNGWEPRDDQMRLWDYLENGGKRAVAVMHRRWGKDDIALHFTATASQERIGNYWHMLPQFNQCRKAIWEAVNPRTGMKRIDEAFPAEMRTQMRSTDMYIGLVAALPGSSWVLTITTLWSALRRSDRFFRVRPERSPMLGLPFADFGRE